MQRNIRELAWYVPYRPIGYKTLVGFLERRKAPKHRQHIQRLLERYGCDDLEGFLKVTHAVSLNDPFWVKQADSDLCWSQVSLYENEFDQLISEAAFDGSMSSSALSTTSPEFGTDGNYAKCWVREDGDIYLYKTGSYQYEVEPLSEFLATQLAQTLCPNVCRFAFVSFNPCRKTKDRPAVWVTISFGLGYRKESPRIDVATEPYPGRWIHHVMVGTPDEIDEELMGWIQEAADFSASKR